MKHGLDKLLPFISNEKITLPSPGRSMEVRPTLMTDFIQLVKEQGMGEDSIIVLQKKGTDFYPGKPTYMVVREDH